jgi:hypothetical protein
MRRTSPTNHIPDQVTREDHSRQEETAQWGAGAPC